MSGSSASAPSEQEISLAATVLRRLEPGFLPVELFLEITRLCAMPIIELVPLRKHNGQTEVLLFRRAADDPNWPNALHTPGTVVRATDVSDGFSVPLSRLYSEELLTQPENEPVFVDVKLHRSNRGTEFAAVLYVDLTGTVAPTGEWRPSEQLPEDLVASQRTFIDKAVELFEKEQQS